LPSNKTKLNHVNLGDCIKGMAQLDAGRVDLAFADPPFNIGYKYDTYNDKQDHQTYLKWSRDWMAGVYRALKPDGSFWLAIGDEYAAELKLIAQNAYPALPLFEAGTAFDEAFMPASLKDSKRRKGGDDAVRPAFFCRSWVIWYYTFGVHCTQKFTRSHAHLFHFVKDPTAFTFNVDDVRVPSARQLVYNDKRANSKGRVPDDTWLISGELPDHSLVMPPEAAALNGVAEDNGVAPVNANGFVLRPQDLPNNFRGDEDVWYYARVAGTFKEREGWHGCQMPEQLLGRIIRACSNNDELVMDPFSGSGTTLAVAKKLGRDYVGFDMSKDYAKYARDRLKKCVPGDPLDGAADAVTSAPTTAERQGVRRKARKPVEESTPLFVD